MKKENIFFGFASDLLLENRLEIIGKRLAINTFPSWFACLLLVVCCLLP
ncbi:MAG: hypothetical protein LBL13_01080 [Bacteroidales bacterium]|nr:hypothetical protein [Bacteroidales bacterium]